MSVSENLSVWLATAPAATFPRLDGDQTADVAIVGAGITGLSAALLLARAGRRVAVIDSGELAHGVSGFTTAHLTTMNDLRYQDAERDFSAEDAQLLAESSRAAIEQIAAFVAEEAIACDFARVDGYLYTEDPGDEGMLHAEIDAAGRAGVAAEWTADPPLPFPVHRAIRVPDQAQLNPLPYFQALARAVERLGGAVYELTHVTGIDGGERCTVTTERGTVTAGAVIIATHMPINDLYLFAKARPYRSYVLGVRIEGAAPVGLFWDTVDPYHYTRAARDERGELLIVGGADHLTGHESDAAERFEQLEAYVRERYTVGEVAYRWSAQWYESIDGLPFIGEYPLRENVYAATGYGGNGMTFGTLAGMLLSDAILGRANPYAELYSINRIKPLAGVPTMIKTGIDEAVRFVADRFRSDADETGEIPLGEGRLIKLDGEQIAAYRDERGVLHKLSPVCTHLGCIVNWNNAEKSWDCPCHGGRYSATGEVIEGPPTESLKDKG
jgi:glycine/D-amino acid oxidase-like deaminating enzyme/nitrite reductase/ring-hydroxylating ferredoxin subunit